MSLWYSVWFNVFSSTLNRGPVCSLFRSQLGTGCSLLFTCIVSNWAKVEELHSITSTVWANSGFFPQMRLESTRPLYTTMQVYWCIRESENESCRASMETAQMCLLNVTYVQTITMWYWTICWILWWLHWNGSLESKLLLPVGLVIYYLWEVFTSDCLSGDKDYHWNNATSL